MDWEELVYAFAEYIPLYGTIYSFRRIVVADQAVDYAKEWISAVNFLGGITREVILGFYYVETVPVVVVHGLAENSSERAMELLTGKGAIHTNHEFKLEKPRRSKDYVNILITGRERKDSDAVVSYMQSNDNFRGVLVSHQAVYMGKFKYDPNPHYASNENLFLTVPHGIRPEAPCQIFTTFTKDAGGTTKRPLTSIIPCITIPGEQDKFRVKRANNESNEFYSFEGFIRDKGKEIRLEMFSKEERVATIQLKLQTQSIP